MAYLLQVSSNQLMGYPLDDLPPSLVSLDARARNLLCKMSGFEPYEPFICQTTFNEQNIIEGTANADGTFAYLLSHTNFDKGAKDPFALLRNSTKKTTKTNYLWGKALVRGKKNRIISFVESEHSKQPKSS